MWWNGRAQRNRTPRSNVQTKRSHDASHLGAMSNMKQKEGESFLIVTVIRRNCDWWWGLWLVKWRVVAVLQCVRVVLWLTSWPPSSRHRPEDCSLMLSAVRSSTVSHSVFSGVYSVHVDHAVRTVLTQTIPTAARFCWFLLSCLMTSICCFMRCVASANVRLSHWYLGYLTMLF